MQLHCRPHSWRRKNSTTITTTRSWSFALLSCGLIFVALPKPSASTEGDTCRIDKLNMNGRCTASNMCESIIDDYFRAGKLTSRDVPSCGFSAREEIVCCPTVKCCPDDRSGISHEQMTTPIRSTTSRMFSTPVERATTTTTTSTPRTPSIKLNKDVEFFDFTKLIGRAQNQTDILSVPSNGNNENANTNPNNDNRRQTHEALRGARLEDPQTRPGLELNNVEATGSRPEPFQSIGPFGQTSQQFAGPGNGHSRGRGWEQPPPMRPQPPGRSQPQIPSWWPQQPQPQPLQRPLRPEPPRQPVIWSQPVQQQQQEQQQQQQQQNSNNWSNRQEAPDRWPSPVQSENLNDNPIRRVNEQLRQQGMNIVEAKQWTAFDVESTTTTSTTTTTTTTIRPPVYEFEDVFAPFTFREPIDEITNNELDNGQDFGKSDSIVSTTTPKSESRNPERPAVTACQRIEAREEIGRQISMHILDGIPVEEGIYPHMAAIGFRSFGTEQFRCGGSLVDKRFVLTAAHCVNDGSPEFVRLGTVDIEKKAPGYQDIAVNASKIVIHPDYVSTSKYHDIAILELESDAIYTPNVYPACLETTLQDPPPTANVFVAGWGVMNTTSA
ncbi:serine protease Hayan isoform X2 [Scaptodrosophila lebanonensis]|uniref:Serine protease Hayan isoform X2 n=1 Tax=Drosophila lebanonensis TaxID=7225 RepID=A0A6J2TVT1_DROLE|nr:serine protease Hayan isoform X2 [Scaptodrosophila lebanonensis]